MFLMEDHYYTGYHGLKGKPTMKFVIPSYLDYVLKQYGEGTTIVFDGYDRRPSTKDTVHVSRTKSKKGISVHFTGEMKLNMKTSEFPTNLENKQWFLERLVTKMNEAKLNVI